MRRNYVDRKMAAAGDRDDDVVVLTVGGLYSPLVVPRPTPSTHSVVQPVRNAPEAFEPGIVRTVKPSPFDVGVEKFRTIMSEHPDHWVPGMSRHCQDDREIVAFFGTNRETIHTSICIGVGRFKDLSTRKHLTTLIVKSCLDSEDNHLVLEKLHPMVYRLTMDRHNLVDVGEEPFSGILLEIGFASRQLDSNQLDYIGQAKVLFPKDRESSVFYLDLSQA